MTQREARKIGFKQEGSQGKVGHARSV
jgi:hypothetical protein